MSGQLQEARPCYGYRLRQAMLGMLLLLLIEAVLPLSVLAYEGDHYVWTYYLALHVGFNRRQAYQIADAAYAIDWDKDTGPMEATPGDAFFGADHTGFVGTAHPEIASIWSRFHAFKIEISNFIGPGDQINIRARNLNELKVLALAEGNPGPYLHLLQDSYAHGEYDTVRGHAIAGHKPDFLSYDEEKARAMTRDTIQALSEFMEAKLGKSLTSQIWHVFMKRWTCCSGSIPYQMLLMLVLDLLKSPAKSSKDMVCRARSIQKLRHPLPHPCSGLWR